MLSLPNFLRWRISSRRTYKRLGGRDSKPMLSKFLQAHSDLDMSNVRFVEEIVVEQEKDS